MAADVRVRIIGDNSSLTSALQGSDNSLLGWAGRVGSALRGLVALAAGSALAGFFKKAVDEALQSEAGINRLHKAVNNAGGGFAAFSKEAEPVIDQMQRMTRATDDELRDALARLITITGDTAGSLKNLALVNDLAAFSGKGLEESAIIVGKAMMGNTKSLKEFGITTKDSGEAMDQLSAKVGGQAEVLNAGLGGALAQTKKQFGEVLEAIGTVIIGSDSLTTGTSALAEALADLADWIHTNEGAIRGGLSGAFEAIGDLIRSTKRDLEVFEGGLKVVVGTSIIFTKTGQDMLREGKALLSSHENQVKASLGAQRNMLRVYAAAFTETYAEETKTHQGNLKKQEDQAATHYAKVVLLNQEATNTILQAQSKLDKSLKDQGLSWEQIKKKADEHATSLRDILLFDKGIKETLEENQRVLDAISDAEKARTQEAKKQSELFKDHVTSARNLAGGIIDAAHAMGLLDDSAASALTSVINMGTSIAAVVGGDLSGVVGIVGSLANIIAGLGDSELQRRIRESHSKNTAAIERLTLSVGDLALNLPGNKFQGVWEALFAARKAAGPGLIKGTEAEGDRARETLLKELAKRGITRAEAEEILRTLGVEGVFDKKTVVGLFAIRDALIAMDKAEIGKIGDSFAEQMRALMDAFEIFKIEDADDKIAELKKLFTRFSPALTDAFKDIDLGSKEGLAELQLRLQALFQKLLSPEGLSPKELGALSGNQLIDAIKQLLGLLGGADAVRLLALPGGGIGQGPPTGGTLGNLGSLDDALGGGPALVNNISGGVNVTINVDGARDPELVAQEIAERMNDIFAQRYSNIVASQGSGVATV